MVFLLVYPRRKKGTAVHVVEKRMAKRNGSESTSLTLSRSSFSFFLLLGVLAGVALFIVYFTWELAGATRGKKIHKNRKPKSGGGILEGTLSSSTNVLPREFASRGHFCVYGARSP